MKKYFEATPSFDGLKERIIVLKENEDKKTLFAVVALVAVLLIAMTAGVVYLLSLNRARADADVMLLPTGGRTLICLGRVMMHTLPVVGK